MIKAIIFDFDGTIMDTESTAFNIWREIYFTHGHELTIDKWAECIGVPVSGFDPYEDLRELTGLPIDRMEMALAYATRESELNKGLPLLPGIEKTILTAKSIGLKLGIASSANHSWIEEHLGRKRLLDRFDAIVCREDTARHKPFPDPYLKIIEVLGCKPSEAIAIEDSPNGIKAAKAAGLFTVAVPNQVTRSLVGDEADIKLKSLTDITLEDLLATAPH
ncbi:MAG TPA: HAD family phosphatase [Desulfomonilia bacterium]